MDVQDNMALLISRYAIDCQPYNTEYKNVTWETCSLRKWLNEAFYNKAFTSEEKAKIILSEVKNDSDNSLKTYLQKITLL